MSDATILVGGETILVDVTGGQGGRGIKGDPGGDASQAGLFDELADLDTGTLDMISVTGRSAVGDEGAGARFIRNDDVDAAYVTANPRTSVISDNGTPYLILPRAPGTISMDEVGWDEDDASPAILEAFNWLKTRGGRLTGRSGQEFVIANDLTFDVAGAAGSLDLDFGGASFTFDTDERIILTGLVQTTHRLAGLWFPHQASDAGMECCIDVVGTNSVLVEDIASNIYDRPAGWSLIRVRQSDPDNPATGPIWPVLRRVTHRVLASGAPPPCTILMQGECNGGLIERLISNGPMTGVIVQPEAGKKATLNTLKIAFSSFEFMGREEVSPGVYEDPGSAVKIIIPEDGDPEPVNYLWAPTMFGCRFEGMAYVWDLSECEAAGPLVQELPTTIGCTATANVAALANNPNAIELAGLDFMGRPFMPPRLIAGGGVTLGASSSIANDVPCITLVDPATGHPVRFMSNGDDVFDLVRESGALEWRAGAIPSSTMAGNGTPVKNPSGTQAISAATSVAVSFGSAEADASYVISLDPQFDPGSGVRFWVSGKGTGGFTINFSSAVTGTVGWQQYRTGQW